MTQSTREVSDKKPDTKERSYKVLAVFHCKVKAHYGTGKLTALIIGPGGGYRLYGTTAIAKYTKLLSVDVAKKLTAPDNLAAALGNVPVIIGKKECIRFLTDNKVPESDIQISDIVEDVPLKSAKGYRTSGSDF